MATSGDDLDQRRRTQSGKTANKLEMVLLGDQGYL
jgi:hypothetical protein